MYSNGRFFPPEYYACTSHSNKNRKYHNWFCNRPLSPQELNSLQVMQKKSKCISPTDDQTERIEISYCDDEMDSLDRASSSFQKESWNISSSSKNYDILNSSQVDYISTSEDDDLLSPREDDEDYQPDLSSSSESYQSVEEIDEVSEAISKNSTACSKNLETTDKQQRQTPENQISVQK